MNIDIDLALTITAGILLWSLVKHIVMVGIEYLKNDG